MRHVIDAIAAQGRGKDTELLHVTKNEMRMLDALKRRATGSDLPHNPRTGIKEAGFFEEWVVPALPAVAGIAAGALTGGTMAAPAAALAGAATGAGTKAIQGGSTQDVLMGGVLGGISGYGAGGIGAGLAGAGAETLAAEGVGQAAVANMGQAGATQASSAMGAMPTLAQSGSALAEGASAAAIPEASVVGATTPAAGAGYGVSTANMGATTPTYVDQMGAGIKSTFGNDIGTAGTFLKNQSGNIGSVGMGTMGLASLQPASTATTETEDTGPGYRGEVYYDANGFRRTRAIPMAEGGLTYGDYDGAEDGQGVRQYAGGGGIGFINSMQPGGAWGELTADAYGVMHENMPGFINDVTPGGFIGATTPGKSDYLAKKAAEEQKKKAEQEAGIAAALRAKELNTLSGSRNYAGGGGIANIAAAKGRYLQGPGDGMSDSIPARIDGKQEAKLATSEFVVPADVVSHIGNGSSEAGAKELHAMMDRIRQARTGTKKQGKQVNPRKYLPA